MRSIAVISALSLEAGEASKFLLGTLMARPEGWRLRLGAPEVPAVMPEVGLRERGGFG